MTRQLSAESDADEIVISPAAAPTLTPSRSKTTKPMTTPRSRPRTIVEVEILSPSKPRKPTPIIHASSLAGPSEPRKTPVGRTNGARTNGSSTPTPVKTAPKPSGSNGTAPIDLGAADEPVFEPLFRHRAGRNRAGFTPKAKPNGATTTPKSSAPPTPAAIPSPAPAPPPPPPPKPESVPEDTASDSPVTFEPLFGKRKGRTPKRLLKPVEPGSTPVSVDTPEPEPLLKRAGRTPLAKNTSSNRGTPVPADSAGGKKTEKAEKATPVRTPAKATAGSKRKTLASSAGKALPTPSASARKRSRQETSTKSTKNGKKGNAEVTFEFQDEYEVEPGPVAISRETFLANEKLRKQREARNFNFDGDANAPKLTRSGRVIGEVEMEVEDVEEEDEEPPTDELAVLDEEVLDHSEAVEHETDVHDEVLAEDQPADVVISAPEPIQGAREVRFESEVDEAEPLPDARAQATEVTVREVEPLAKGARLDVLDMLATLTGRGIASDPPPFAKEDKNEALNGLVNLLNGTVERGEGNSALLVGARGVGKTRTIARALRLLPSTSSTSPIVVRLSGLAQTNDRLAIREMGRQIAEAEGSKVVAEEDEEDAADDAEYAPTTLPSHLLALLTKPSARSIIIVMEEFDLFTEHARQALLYCLLDVVQSVKTGPVESTGRGVAVIGITSRVDTLLLLEKRVKSRFSHRMWRVLSPLSPETAGWKALLPRALVPWMYGPRKEVEQERALWRGDWQFAIATLLKHEKVIKSLDRLCSLTTDVRMLYRPFIQLLTQILSNKLDFLSVPLVTQTIIHQIENSGWGLATTKLKGLPHPAVGVLIITKHLSYIGREEFTFAMVEEEYLKFSRTKLVGSGRSRWPLTVLRSGFDHLLKCSLLVSAGTGSVKPRFAKVRSTVSPHEVVAWMKGEGAVGLGPEMVGWGRLMGGHL